MLHKSIGKIILVAPQNKQLLTTWVIFIREVFEYLEYFQ